MKASDLIRAFVRELKVILWASLIFALIVPRSEYLENNRINSKRDWHGVLLLVKKAYNFEKC